MRTVGQNEDTIRIRIEDNRFGEDLVEHLHEVRMSLILDQGHIDLVVLPTVSHREGAGIAYQGLDRVKLAQEGI